MFYLSRNTVSFSGQNFMVNCEIQSAEEGCESQQKYLEKKVSWDEKHLLINNEPRNRIIAFEYALLYLPIQSELSDKH